VREAVRQAVFEGSGRREGRGRWAMSPTRGICEDLVGQCLRVRTSIGGAAPTETVPNRGGVRAHRLFHTSAHSRPIRQWGRECKSTSACADGVQHGGFRHSAYPKSTAA
jgi:hypothetical protein